MAVICSQKGINFLSQFRKMPILCISKQCCCIYIG